MCVFVLWTSCLRAKIHYYYMWPFAKKLYHGWSTMTSSNEISWKCHPPEMKSWRALALGFELDFWQLVIAAVWCLRLNYCGRCAWNFLPFDYTAVDSDIGECGRVSDSCVDQVRSIGSRSIVMFPKTALAFGSSQNPNLYTAIIIIANFTHPGSQQ